MNLIDLTSFNPLDPMSYEHVELDADSIVSVVPSHTGDGHDYTTVTLSVGGGVFFVKETVSEVFDAIKESKHE